MTLILAVAVGPMWSAVVGWKYWRRLPTVDQTWATALGLDIAPVLIWLGLLPVAWWLGRSSGPVSARWRHHPIVMAAVVGLTALTAAIGFGWSVQHLPPLYHDEYAYQFQAQTFLQGRILNPVPPLVEHFDQMHILTNADRGWFISRYFPGTALSLLPFVAWGRPVWSGWTFHALIAVFTALAGRQLHPRIGWIAGLLTATAPGMIMLSQLQLSSLPTMLGIMFFWWMQQQPGRHAALLAGLGMGFAFVTRPLTAVGLGLPFAVNAIIRWKKQRRDMQPPLTADRDFSRLVVGFAVWVIMLGCYQWRITGNPLRSPYSIYTETRTPSHVFGFGNRTWGLAHRSDHTIVPYDDWAADHTATRGVQLVWQRWFGVNTPEERTAGLIDWTWGRPIVILLGVAAIGLTIESMSTVLMLAALLGLTMVYFPFAFPGIMGWGYLFEAMPVLALLVGVGLHGIMCGWEERQRPDLAWWTGWLCPIVMVFSLLRVLPAFDVGSEFVFPRLQAQERRNLERKHTQEQPVLLLFDGVPGDAVHQSLVHNRPDLDGPVVRAWTLHRPLDPLLADFPDRPAYRCHPDRPLQWTRIR